MLNSVEPTIKNKEKLLGEARNITYQTSGKELIKNVSFKLSSDKISIIMGHNGAGKSIMLRILHGLVKPTEGKILWDGKPISEDIRKTQAMVFQRPVLLRRSVAANIDFVLNLHGKATTVRRNEMLEHVGLLEHASQPARLLSGGEQQRLALARALSLNPRVLFLDEPTASLDPASVGMIEDIIKKANKKGVKIIFITHDIGQAKRLADEIIFMSQGKIVEQTNAETFFNKTQSKEAQNYLEGSLGL